MSEKSTTEEFVGKARKVHGGTYDYSGAEYVRAINKVEICCRKHGVFWQTPNDHLNGRGCSKCGVDRRTELKKKSSEDFVLDAKKVHGELYGYSHVDYINARKKVRIDCRIHGAFCVTPDNHIGKSSGCPKCAGLKIGKAASARMKGCHHNNFAGSLKSRTDDFIVKAKRIHGETLDYSKVVFKSIHNKVILVCSKHGDFCILPSRNLRGAGCPLCAREGRRLEQDEFVKRSIAIHGLKYDYSKAIYFNSNTKVIIGCPVHGEFSQNPSQHLSGRGCPTCRESRGEKAVARWLESRGVEHKRQKELDGCINPKTGRPLYFDFYLLNRNMCIEFDGEQHFVERTTGMFRGKLEEIKYRDKIKNAFCTAKGIVLLRIPYTEISIIGDVLERNVN